MSFPVRAITLDLDDTIWPIEPVIVRAEAVLGAWLERHAPRTAARWPLEARRVLREEVAATHPHLAHDFTRQRIIALERMFAEAGDDTALAGPAFDVFFAARCEVEHYADSLDALDRLAARVPLAALTNGNADLERIGLMHVFRFQLGAREHGAAKPEPSIFHAACERLGCVPGEVLHVGDDIEMDVVGAHRAGLRSCWINRDDACSGEARPGQARPGDARLARRAWPRDDVRPDLEFPSLDALADWLDAQPTRQDAA